MKHSVEHLRFPKAPVEAITEFRQVAGQMLGADAMVDTSDVTFNIGDQGMDPGQDLRGLLPRTGHQPLMTDIGSSIQEAIALPAIGLNHRLSRQALPYKWLNLSAADRGTIRMAANLGFFAVGVSTATTTLALPAAPRPRLPGFGAPK